MTLRRRLFLVLGGLAAALVLAQWWWVRSLTRELTLEVDSVAMVVGSSVASLLSDEGPVVDIRCPDDEPDCEQAVRVIRRLHTVDRQAGIETVADTETDTDGRHTFTMRFETRRDGDVVVDEVITGDATALAPGHEHSDHDPAVLWTWETEIERAHTDAETGDGHVALAPRTELSPETIAHIVRHDRATREEAGDDEADTGPRFHFFSNADLHRETRFLVLDRPDGTARVPIPRRGLATKIDEFRSRLLLGSVGMLAVALAAAALLAHRVSAPLRRLAGAADEVGSGELGVQVDATVTDREVRRTIDAFNHMSSRLVELDARARRADALRHLGEIGDIARGLAHTLRNPLNALGLSVDELAARVDDVPGTDDLAEGARRQIRRIDQGVRSFLVLASPTGGAVEPVDVGELVRDVALEALQDGGGRARVEVDVPTARARVDAVGPELRAAIQAVVVNAVEASPEGGTVDVRLRAESAEDGTPRCVLTVDDRGPGLPDTVRDRLFTPHLSTKPNGSGMGLFLAHRVAVHRYGGSLDLSDREGGGTRARLVVGPRRTPGDTQGERETTP